MYPSTSFPPSPSFPHSVPPSEQSSIPGSVSVSCAVFISVVYSDGGPDHNVTFLTTKLSFINLLCKAQLRHFCSSTNCTSSVFKEFCRKSDGCSQCSTSGSWPNVSECFSTVWTFSFHLQQNELDEGFVFSAPRPEGGSDQFIGAYSCATKVTVCEAENQTAPLCCLSQSIFSWVGCHLQCCPWNWFYSHAIGQEVCCHQYQTTAESITWTLLPFSFVHASSVGSLSVLYVNHHVCLMTSFRNCTISQKFLNKNINLSHPVLYGGGRRIVMCISLLGCMLVYSCLVDISFTCIYLNMYTHTVVSVVCWKSIILLPFPY